MMTQRQKTILERITKMYIDSGQPVSSLSLADKLGFPISSAMLRIEMAALEEAGWLEQPHTSSGRVPTLKAMRWFAQALMEAQEPRKVAANSGTPQDLTDRVSRTVKTAAAFVGEPEGKIALSGLHYLADAPEVFDQELVGECLSMLEVLVNRVQDLFAQVPAGNLFLYVGDENPFVAQPHFSMIMGRIPQKSLGPGILALMGPVRMDYGRAIAILKGFVNE